jgi:hypothetical protein
VTCEGTVTCRGCRDLQGGAVTCHKEPLSILVGAAVYSSGCRCLFCLISTSALFAVRVRVLVVGVLVFPCVLTVVA